MDIRTIILGLLTRGGMTGYELKKVFSISFTFFSGLSYGSIYPALKKMEGEGLISMDLQLQDGAPNRKVYAMTEKGRAFFKESIREPLVPETKRQPFIMHLFFFADLSPEERLKKAVGYLESIRRKRESVAAAKPAVNKVADRFQLISYDFGLRFLEDLERNVERVVRSIKEPAGQEPAGGRNATGMPAQSHGKSPGMTKDRRTERKRKRPS